MIDKIVELFRKFLEELFILFSTEEEMDVPKEPEQTEDTSTEITDSKDNSADASDAVVIPTDEIQIPITTPTEEEHEPVITPTKTIDELAQEVLNGVWGSGDERKRRLTEAGYDYYAVQARVNEIINSEKHTYSGTLPTLSLVKSNAEVIADTVKWAVMIAGDNRFHYGYGKYAHHNGCYFCGTQKLKKGHGITDYERTYCCNPFVGAAWAHGGCVPKALKMCQDCDSWDYHAGAGYDKSSLFDNLGKPAKSKLKKGDVCCNDSHVFLYIGDGKIVEASGGDDNKRNSSKWNKSIHVANLTNSKYNGVKRVHRFNGSVNTTAILRYGEISNRIALWQEYLNWYFDGAFFAQCGGADGIYGDNTLVWTKKFQAEQFGEKEADGLVGQITLQRAGEIMK